MPIPESTEEREQLRRECHEDLIALRSETLPERAFRLLEKLVARLDRLETGSFFPTEAPTEPERIRGSSSSWRNDGVIRALEDGRKKKT